MSNEMERLWYAGGIAEVGGVEDVTVTTLLELRRRRIDFRVSCWSRRSRYLDELREAGVPVTRSRVTYGCRWAIPDEFLLLQAQRPLHFARTVVLAKLMPVKVHRKLRAAAPGARFILITPYRPAELARNAMAAGELKEILETFDLVIVQAESFKYDLDALGYSGQVEVVPYIPRDTYALSPMGQHASVRVGFLGRLAAQKNLPALLTAYRAAAERWKERGLASELHLIGDGPERVRIERLVQEFRIADQVHLAGSTDRGCVDAAIDSCDVFAFTSHTEGQCLAAMEILRRGRPIVATAVGALPDLVFEPSLGSVVDPGTEEAFADALFAWGIRVKETPHAAAGIRRMFDRRFDRDSIVQRYVELLGSELPRAQPA